MSITLGPAETDSPLVIDANTVLASAIAPKFLEPVARRSPKVVKGLCGVKHNQLAEHGALQNRGIPPNRLTGEQALRIAIRKASDHDT